MVSIREKCLIAVFIWCHCSCFGWYAQPIPVENIQVTSRSYFLVPSARYFLDGLGKLFFNRPARRGVFLPKVDISAEFDLSPSLVAYDPSFIDFKPPPQIPPSDGYKTQFVCDYDYDPLTDPGTMYLEYCFYYLYTPKMDNKISWWSQPLEAIFK